MRAWFAAIGVATTRHLDRRRQTDFADGVILDVMDPKQIVHSDPEIVSGTPVFVGTRVPAQALLDYLEGGETIEEFLDDFPSVSREQAIAFLEEAGRALLARIA
jgi:uncharacterized protein (DUF433 family)